MTALRAVTRCARAGLLGLQLLTAPACERAADRAASIDVAAALGGDADPRFSRALAPRPFRFPADHGPHPRFRTEWWYFTGNLESDLGERFGFQLTFFRTALTPEPATRRSAWATSQLYMAHFALSDVARGRFHHAERFARGAAGLAGAAAVPFRVWLEDWSATGIDDPFPVRLDADGGEFAIELTLDRRKPCVAHGDHGLSRKGPGVGNASYYYSCTRLDASGQVRGGDRTHAVDGEAWLDREWSTSVLGEGQVGWDWFSIQLDDGRELMLFQLRNRSGGHDPHAAGTLVTRDGIPRPLTATEFAIEVTATWNSPAGGRYPSGWRVRVPGEALELTLEPILRDQELRGALRYWEGAVQASGQAAGRPVGGHGYVELTGYTAPPPATSGR